MKRSIRSMKNNVKFEQWRKLYLYPTKWLTRLAHAHSTRLAPASRMQDIKSVVTHKVLLLECEEISAIFYQKFLLRKDLALFVPWVRSFLYKVPTGLMSEEVVFSRGNFFKWTRKVLVSDPTLSNKLTIFLIKFWSSRIPHLVCLAPAWHPHKISWSNLSNE